LQRCKSGEEIHENYRAANARFRLLVHAARVISDNVAYRYRLERFQSACDMR
jgi:hypothetical protein